MYKTNTQLIEEIENNINELHIGLTYTQDKRLKKAIKTLKKRLRNDYRLCKKEVKKFYE